MIRMTKFLFFCSFLTIFSPHAVFASRVLFDAKFFQDIDQIVIYVNVYSTSDNTATQYLYDQDAVSSPLSLEEITSAVTSSFKSQFSGFDVEVLSRQDVQDEEKSEVKLQEYTPSADPFSATLPSEKERADVYIYVVLKKYSTEKEGSLVYGAISSKILKGGNGGRNKKASDMELEAFPQPFILPNSKEEAVEVIMKKTAEAFKMQRQWMLCKRHTKIKCYSDYLDNLNEK